MGVFEDIYKHNSWGFGSGHGSLPRVTKDYRKFLEDFILENDIKTIVDYGCGDWQFSKLVNWGKVHYTGLDIVQSLIKTNNKAHGTKTIKFALAPKQYKDLPKAELLIVKDVLQHWPNSEIKKFLKEVQPKFKYILLTNCIIPRGDINIDTPMGGFRPLDIRLDPFNINAVSVLAFDGPRARSLRAHVSLPAWRKIVLLISR